MPLTASQRNIPLTPAADPNQGYAGGAGPGGAAQSFSSSSGSNGIDMVESGRIWVSSLASRMWGSVSVETLRPLPMFLGISGNNFCMSAEAFTPPIKKIELREAEKLRSRIKLNLSFFLTNYALVAFGVALVVALMHPSMIFSLGCVWGFWWFHNYLISNEVMVPGVNKNLGSLVSIAHRFYALFVMTVLVVFWKCFRPFLIFSGITGVIVIAHSVMRNPKDIDKYQSAQIKRGSSDSDDEEEVLVDRPKTDV